MLESLRSVTGGWIAKIFIVLLSASFAVWGIADIFGGYGGAAVATVGEAEVSNNTFRVTFQNRMQRIGQQTGRPMTLEQARAFGLHQQVLGELVTEATLDNDARIKGLGVSEKAIGRGIVEDPTFRDSFDSFSRSAYEQFLAYSGMSEAQYVNERRKARLRRQLTTSLASGIVAPQTLIDAFHRFSNETRVVKYVTIGRGMIDPLPDPDEATLTAYFEENQAAFRAPEYRRIELILADTETIANSIEISEDQLQELYESRSTSLEKPEKREILQLLFDSEAEAKEAAAKIASGSSFTQVASDMGRSREDISLGLIDESAIFDPAIRDAAFALDENAISEPVKGSLGYALLNVTKIEPAGTPRLDEVRDTLRQELVERLTEDRVLDMFDAVEDDRAAGLTFAESAAKNGIPYKVIEAIDSEGKDADGTPIEGLPQIDSIVGVAFDTDPGVEADPIQLDDNGFVWVNVTEIIDARDRTIDEVRDKLDERWRRDEQRKRMSEKANELVDRLNAGATLTEIAVDHGVAVRTSTPLKRSSTNDAFDRSAVSTVFATPEDGAGTAPHANGKDRILFRIDSVALDPSDPASDESQEMAESLTLSLSEDLLGAYVRVKQEKFGVTVNQRNLDILTGLASDQGQ